MPPSPKRQKRRPGSNKCETVRNLYLPGCALGMFQAMPHNALRSDDFFVHRSIGGFRKPGTGVLCGRCPPGSTARGLGEVEGDEMEHKDEKDSQDTEAKVRMQCPCAPSRGIHPPRDMQPPSAHASPLAA